MPKVSAKYIDKHADYLQCSLCPNRCKISDGKSGLCKVRFNKEGKPELPFYGKLSALSVDPIEKKPLYHFHPAEQILSVGFVGCSLRCPFCQNYNISQSTERGLDFVSPSDLAEAALRKNSFGIAYTYSEPIVHLEYVSDASREARDRGLKNVLVSNGYITKEASSELAECIDAANIDLKCYSNDFYKRELGGALDPVLEFISFAADKMHLEVTTLVIPGKNDSDEEIGSIASFLSEISPDIPYHLSCYYPTYNYSIPPTEAASVRRLADAAREKLNYVYLGNVGLEETNTSCPSCGKLIVRRSGYSTKVVGLTGDGACSGCGEAIPIISG